MVLQLGLNDERAKLPEYKNAFYFKLSTENNIQQIEEYLETFPETIPSESLADVQGRLKKARKNEASIIFLDGTIKDGALMNCIDVIQVTDSKNRPVLVNINDSNRDVIKGLTDSYGNKMKSSLRLVFSVLHLDPIPYLDVKTGKLVRAKYRKELFIVHRDHFMNEFVHILQNMTDDDFNLRGVKLHLQRPSDQMSKTTGQPANKPAGRGVFSFGSLLTEAQLKEEFGSSEVKGVDGRLLAHANSSLMPFNYERDYFKELSKEELTLRLEGLGVLKPFKPAAVSSTTVPVSAKQAVYAPQFPAPLPVSSLTEMPSDDFMTEDDIPF